MVESEAGHDGVGDHAVDDRQGQAENDEQPLDFFQAGGSAVGLDGLGEGQAHVDQQVGDDHGVGRSRRHHQAGRAGAAFPDDQGRQADQGQSQGGKVDERQFFERGALVGKAMDEMQKGGRRQNAGGKGQPGEGRDPAFGARVGNQPEAKGPAHGGHKRQGEGEMRLLFRAAVINVGGDEQVQKHDQQEMVELCGHAAPTLIRLE